MSFTRLQISSSDNAGRGEPEEDADERWTDEQRAVLPNASALIKVLFGSAGIL